MPCELSVGLIFSVLPCGANGASHLPLGSRRRFWNRAGCSKYPPVLTPPVTCSLGTSLEGEVILFSFFYSCYHLLKQNVEILLVLLSLQHTNPFQKDTFAAGECGCFCCCVDAEGFNEL